MIPRDSDLPFSSEGGRVFATGLNDFGQLGIGSSMPHTLVLVLLVHRTSLFLRLHCQSKKLRHSNSKPDASEILAETN